MCREHAPSIIFMDEVDSIGSARSDSGGGGGGGDSEVQRTMLELLNQLDGFEATNKIKVSVCTPALMQCELSSIRCLMQQCLGLRSVCHGTGLEASNGSQRVCLALTEHCPKCCGLQESCCDFWCGYDHNLRVITSGQLLAACVLSFAEFTALCFSPHLKAACKLR